VRHLAWSVGSVTNVPPRMPLGSRYTNGPIPLTVIAAHSRWVREAIRSGKRMSLFHASQTGINNSFIAWPHLMAEPVLAHEFPYVLECICHAASLRMVPVGIRPDLVALPQLVEFGFGHLHEPDTLIASGGNAAG
jgi:hypothetical protein